jgi:hypothetical protein
VNAGVLPSSVRRIDVLKVIGHAFALKNLTKKFARGLMIRAFLKPEKLDRHGYPPLLG